MIIQKKIVFLFISLIFLLAGSGCDTQKNTILENETNSYSGKKTTNNVSLPNFDQLPDIKPIISNDPQRPIVRFNNKFLCILERKQNSKTVSNIQTIKGSIAGDLFMKYIADSFSKDTTSECDKTNNSFHINISNGINILGYEAEHILFDSGLSNISLKGKVFKNPEKIHVRAINTGKSIINHHTLKKYNSGDINRQYNINPEYGNIAEGDNHYFVIAEYPNKSIAITYLKKTREEVPLPIGRKEISYEKFRLTPEVIENCGFYGEEQKNYVLKGLRFAYPSNLPFSYCHDTGVGTFHHIFLKQDDSKYQGGNYFSGKYYSKVPSILIHDLPMNRFGAEYTENPDDFRIRTPDEKFREVLPSHVSPEDIITLGNGKLEAFMDKSIDEKGVEKLYYLIKTPNNVVSITFVGYESIEPTLITNILNTLEVDDYDPNVKTLNVEQAKEKVKEQNILKRQQLIPQDKISKIVPSSRMQFVEEVTLNGETTSIEEYIKGDFEENILAILAITDKRNLTEDKPIDDFILSHLEVDEHIFATQIGHPYVYRIGGSGKKYIAKEGEEGFPRVDFQIENEYEDLGDLSVEAGGTMYFAIIGMADDPGYGNIEINTGAGYVQYYGDREEDYIGILEKISSPIIYEKDYNKNVMLLQQAN